MGCSVVPDAEIALLARFAPGATQELHRFVGGPAECARLLARWAPRQRFGAWFKLDEALRAEIGALEGRQAAASRRDAAAVTRVRAVLEAAQRGEPTSYDPADFRVWLKITVRGR